MRNSGGQNAENTFLSPHIAKFGLTLSGEMISVKYIKIQSCKRVSITYLADSWNRRSTVSS